MTPGNFPHSDFGYSRWVLNGAPRAPNPLQPATNPAPSLLRVINTLQAVYAPQIRAQPFRLSTTGADLRPDLAGTQAPGFFETISAGAAPSGGTIDEPFWGQAFPANAYLPGPGRSTNNDYTLASVFIDQRAGPVNIELGYSRGFLVAPVTSRGVAAMKSGNTGLAAAAPKDAARVPMGGAHELAERVWPIVDALRSAALLGETVEVAAQESAEAALAWTP